MPDYHCNKESCNQIKVRHDIVMYKQKFYAVITIFSALLNEVIWQSKLNVPKSHNKIF
jgi:hypothetical protein